MAWKLFSRRRTVRPSRRTYFKPRLEALEDRTLLDNGFGLSLPLGMNQVAPTPLRDLSNNSYWKAVSSPITHSSFWLTALAPSLNQSIHFEGNVFGGVDIKPQFLQGPYGTQVQYKDNFVVPDILDQGSTTTVTITGSETIGFPNTLNVTSTGSFTDPSFLGTPLSFKVNYSSNTQFQGTLLVGWSGSGNLSGSNLFFFAGDNFQGTLSLSQPQSSGPANLSWQTNNTYNASNLMSSNDSLKTHLWGAGYIDSSGNVNAQNFNWTLGYQASNFYAQNDKLSVNANLSVDQYGNFNGGLSSSYTGSHVFTNNDYLVFFMNIGNPPSNWSGPAVIGAQYNLGNGFAVGGQWQGTFGSNNQWDTVPPQWWLGGSFSGNGFNAGFQVNPNGAQLIGDITW